jgi:hypothetical protein
MPGALRPLPYGIEDLLTAPVTGTTGGRAVPSKSSGPEELAMVNLGCVQAGAAGLSCLSANVGSVRLMRRQR